VTRLNVPSGSHCLPYTLSVNGLVCFHLLDSDTDYGNVTLLLSYTMHLTFSRWKTIDGEVTWVPRYQTGWHVIQYGLAGLRMISATGS